MYTATETEQMQETYRYWFGITRAKGMELDIDTLELLSDLRPPANDPMRQGQAAGWAQAWLDRTIQPNDPGYYPNYSEE